MLGLGLAVLVGCSTTTRPFSEGDAGADTGGSSGRGDLGAVGGRHVGGATGEQSTDAAGSPADGIGGEGGSSSDVSCVPGQGLCEGDRALVCNDMGTGYAGVGVKCLSTQTCVAGSCEELECAPNKRFCEGESVRRCADSGLSSTLVVSCEADEYCDAASASCKTGVCSPGAPACDGDRATTCTQDGSGYASGGKACGSEETCTLGECRVQVCKPNAMFCQGQDLKTCSETGLSSSVSSTCINQACVASGSTAGCSGICAPGQTKCAGNGTVACGANGTWGTSATACPAITPICSAGACSTPPSCAGLPIICGANGNDSCCSSPSVPGGTFNRSNDSSYPATVSAFRLDRYEVSVGRFRKFVESYAQSIVPAGAGKNPNNSADVGWDTSWNSSLPANKAALLDSIKCNTGQQNNNYETWTSSVGGNELRPMNCLNWFVANAFCSWDGGRLPSEAEWNYAAAGGSEQRLYPWGSTMPGNDAKLAVYGCNYGGNGDGVCVDLTNIAPVGSVTAGNAKWGQADLAGGMAEWIADWWSSPYPQPTCNDCINLSAGGSMQRSLRGSGWAPDDSPLNSNRGSWYPSSRDTGTGVRCARPQ